MRPTAPLFAGLLVLASLQAPAVEASPKHHNHNSSCTHKNTSNNSHGKSNAYKGTLVVRPAQPSPQHHYHGSSSVVVVTPTPTVQYRHHPYYGYRQYPQYYYTNPTPTYAQPPVRPAPPPVQQAQPTYNQRVREVGARFVGGGAIDGADTSLVGAGAYLRLRNTSRFLGFEASVDSTATLNTQGQAVANQVPMQGAALLYLNPQSPLRLYGLLGGGITLEQSALGASQALTAQVGGGFDLDAFQRASFSIDFRGVTTDSTTPVIQSTLVSPATVDTNLVMNMGLSIKF